MTNATDVSALSFEQALKELEGIVARLEQGSVPLEESISIYELGDALRKHCDGLLKAAEAKVEKIRVAGDGSAAGTSAGAASAAGGLMVASLSFTNGRRETRLGFFDCDGSTAGRRPLSVSSL